MPTNRIYSHAYFERYEANLDSIELAQQIATAAHQGQFRRDGVTPYIEHPKAVVEALIRKGASWQCLCVGWLHDVLEVGECNPNTLIAAWTSGRTLGEEVLEGLVAITKVKGESYEAYLTRVKANPIAREVKLCDIAHNLSDSPSDYQIRKYAKALLFLVDELVGAI